MPATDVSRTLEAIWRIESAKIVGALTRMVRDVGLAEELAQDAMIAALERWPKDGLPDRPGAWLMATARRRALDLLRRGRMILEKHEIVAAEIASAPRVTEAEIDAAIDEVIGDDVLRLVFMACHPVLSAEARVALTLRLVGGLTTAEIARGYLVPEPTIAQRIVRAKKTLAEAGVPFELPAAADLGERLRSVLDVIYLVFNEGYSATAGADWVRTELCHEALRLGRILAELAPHEPEVHGLVALMELQASRLHARVDAAGEPVLLLDQDRARWDPLLIRRGLAALARAESLGREPGPLVLQAALAACHARARTPAETDWAGIVGLYDSLARVAPSPIVELNRAVAVSMASGPAAALPLVDAIARSPAMRGYHLLPSVRGDLLFKLGRFTEARAEFERAAGMTRNEREQALLRRRADEAARAGADPA